MLIRCKHIYNFLCSMLVLHQLSYVLSMLRCTFYAFSGTNLLTRCHSASSCFLLFCISEKLYRKYSRNGTKQKPKFLFSAVFGFRNPTQEKYSRKRTGQKPEVLYLSWQHRRPRGSRRHAAGRPHPSQARPRAGPCLGMVSAPWPPPYVASPPI